MLPAGQAELAEVTLGSSDLEKALVRAPKDQYAELKSPIPRWPGKPVCERCPCMATLVLQDEEDRGYWKQTSPPWDQVCRFGLPLREQEGQRIAGKRNQLRAPIFTQHSPEVKDSRGSVRYLLTKARVRSVIPGAEDCIQLGQACHCRCGHRKGV